MAKEKNLFFEGNASAFEKRGIFTYSFGFGEEFRTALLFAMGLFLIPFLPLNQLIIGSVVNALLIGCALKVKTNKTLLLAFIPSIAAFSAGILFGNATHALVIMLPFIWAGNLVLMALMRKMLLQRESFRAINYFRAGVVGAAWKTGVIFISAFALFSFGELPIIALTAFGGIQLLTALIGSGIYFGANTIRKQLAF